MVLTGCYTVRKLIGQGGHVYLAWDKFAECLVAIKDYFPASVCNRLTSGVVKGASSGDRAELFQKGLKRVLRESQARLSHPNIIAVADFFEQNCTGYLQLYCKQVPVCSICLTSTAPTLLVLILKRDENVTNTAS